MSAGPGSFGVAQNPPPAGIDPRERAAAQRRLRWALLITLGILALEIVGGILTGSLALLADAGHVLGDAGAIGLALGALWLSARPSGQRRTYGWYRVEIMAAQLNGAALLVLAGLIIWRAVVRFGDDPVVDGWGLLGVAGAGLAANVAAMRILSGSARSSLNVRGAYYHVLGDTAGSLGALLAGVVIITSGWTPIDLVAGIGIAVLLIVSGLRLLRESTDILLEAAPPGVEIAAVAEEICRVPGVLGVHDLHLWTVTSGFPALSCHVEVAEDADAQRILVPISERLREQFGLQHITLQPESAALHQQMQCCDFPDQAGLREFSVGHREPAPPPSA